MKSSQFIAVIVAVIALLWIGSGFLTGDADEAGSDQATAEAEGKHQGEKKLVDVRIKEINSQLYTSDVIITGRSGASRIVELRAETSGQIVSIVKEEGHTVTENEVIAKIELQDRAARVREGEERVNQRQIQYNASKSLEHKGFNSRVRLAESRADLESARAALKLAQVDLAKTSIKAPFDGIISEQMIESGDFLSVGNPLFTIVDLDPIELVGFVSERDIGNIEPKGQATAVFLGGRKVQGVVSYIAPAADQQTRTFKIEVTVPNADLSLKDGLTAKISIPIKPKPAHQISPSILALEDDGTIGVKIVGSDNVVKFVPVHILAHTPEEMWVSGLPEKTRLITVGQEFVSEGQRVNPVSSDEGGLL